MVVSFCVSGVRQVGGCEVGRGRVLLELGVRRVYPTRESMAESWVASNAVKIVFGSGRTCNSAKQLIILIHKTTTRHKDNRSNLSMDNFLQSYLVLLLQVILDY